MLVAVMVLFYWFSEFFCYDLINYWNLNQTKKNGVSEKFGGPPVEKHCFNRPVMRGYKNLWPFTIFCLKKLHLGVIIGALVLWLNNKYTGLRIYLLQMMGCRNSFCKIVDVVKTKTLVRSTKWKLMGKSINSRINKVAK